MKLSTTRDSRADASKVGMTRIAWDEAAERIVRAGWRSVLVLGAVDVGKSHFCGLLADTLLRMGRRVALIDADLGQKTIGPPATITLGYPHPSATGGRTPPSLLHFVGSTSPAGHFLPLVAGAAALAGAARADHVVIDTDGMVTPPGLFLKSQMIDAVRPDALIAIERCEELARLRCATPLAVLRLAPSEAARSKSKAARAAARRQAFAAYFREATTVDMPVEALAIQHLALAPRDWDLVPGRLCGTVDAAGWGSGLAIIAGVDMPRHRIGLITPVAPDAIRALRPGSILLAPDGRELRRDRDRGAADES
jgi:polynucleotide 5'-hydroxyl-kinase GRC3/NOL9